jgi:O-antigen ligase
MSLRFEAWEMFLRMSREKFIFGHGLDDAVMSEHYRVFYKSLRGVYPLEGEQPTTPHNQFIKILYQQGIIGFIAYLLMFSILIYRVVERFYTIGSIKFSFIGIAIVSAVIGEYVIRCMSEDRSLIPLGILIGMAGAFLRKENKIKGVE